MRKDFAPPGTPGALGLQSAKHQPQTVSNSAIQIPLQHLKAESGVADCFFKFWNFYLFIYWPKKNKGLHPQHMEVPRLAV